MLPVLAVTARLWAAGRVGLAPSRLAVGLHQPRADQAAPPLLAEPLSTDDAEQLAAPLKALADPARLRILSLIQAQPSGEACVCHLTEPLDLTQGTVSHHLRVLREAGLVERDQRGSWAYYRVVPESLAALRTLLA